MDNWIGKCTRMVVVAGIVFFSTVMSGGWSSAGAAEDSLPYIAPAEVAPVPYRVEIAKGGALKISLKESSYVVNSSFSMIPGWANLEEENSPGFSKLKVGKDSIKAETESFYLERKITRHPECIEVADTLTNKTSENLPVMIRHSSKISPVTEYRLGGLRVYLKRGFSSRPANPTTIAMTENGSFGILPLDDVFRVHIQNFAAGDMYGIANNKFVLRPKGSYTLRFAVFPSEKKDYFSQINAMRRYLGVNFQIPAAFAFTLARAPEIDLPVEVLRQKLHDGGITFASSSINRGEIPSYKGVVPHGTIFATSDHSQYRKMRSKIEEADPAVNYMIYHHCFISVDVKDKERHPDSMTLNPDGTQADYRDPRYPLYFPTLTNSYGKEISKVIDVILNDIGCDGVYWDEFEYSSVQYHYGEPWDGYSADIDPRTHKITRLKSSVILLTQPWRMNQVDRIYAGNKVLVINANPATETSMKATTKYKIPRFVETGTITNCVLAHLGTPIALGDHLTERNEVDVYRGMLNALYYGCVSYFYRGFNWITRPSLAKYMFPITPVELGNGYIIGKERIVTKKSGYYSFGDKSKAEAHFFDADGKKVARDLPAVNKDGKTYYKVVLGENESVALVRK